MEALKQGLARVAKSQVKRGIIAGAVAGTLEFFFGPALHFSRGTLDAHEAAFAKEVMHFEGRSFTGTFDKINQGLTGS